MCHLILFLLLIFIIFYFSSFSSFSSHSSGYGIVRPKLMSAEWIAVAVVSVLYFTGGEERTNIITLSHLCQLVLCQSHQIIKNKSLTRMIVSSSLIHRANDFLYIMKGRTMVPEYCCLFFFSFFFRIYISLYIYLSSNWRICTPVLTATIAQITTIVEVNNSHGENEDRWAVRYQMNLFNLILLYAVLYNLILSCRNLVFVLSHSLNYLSINYIPFF